MLFSFLGEYQRDQLSAHRHRAFGINELPGREQPKLGPQVLPFGFHIISLVRLENKWEFLSFRIEEKGTGGSRTFFFSFFQITQTGLYTLFFLRNRVQDGLNRPFKS